ncbi:MAG: hypothetical protein KTR19_08060, partial [Hyphomicrobiales bacterium]|nr:hypothetical protein [Hyphomicrobiales bacterium]
IGPKSGHRFSDQSDASTKEHRTEKWAPVFGSIRCFNKRTSDRKVGTGFRINPMLQQKNIGPKSGPRFSGQSDASTKEHRTEKWMPVFGQIRCFNKRTSDRKVDAGFRTDPMLNKAIERHGRDWLTIWRSRLYAGRASAVSAARLTAF